MIAWPRAVDFEQDLLDFSHSSSSMISHKKSGFRDQDISQYDIILYLSADFPLFQLTTFTIYCDFRHEILQVWRSSNASVNIGFSVMTFCACQLYHQISMGSRVAVRAANLGKMGQVGRGHRWILRNPPGWL